MASDVHMTETLTAMLQDGETLMYPIFGNIKRGGFGQFAYFGFTESHFLIAYLSGEKVTGTERIPLDIKSIRIKKQKIFKEHTIDILFENKRSYTISAFPGVLKIKEQAQNFPSFLEYLKGKAQKQAQTLEEMDGEKIRWQYFNTYIYIMLSVIPAVFAMLIMQELKKGNVDIWTFMVEMSGAIPFTLAMYGIILGPFIVLSIFNRFAFGKILGVTSEDTLFLENRETPIKDITQIVYHPRVMSKTRAAFSYATFYVSTNENRCESFDVVHFPIYGLRKIKKCNREIKLKCDNFIWLFALCPTVVFAVLGFLL